MQELSFYHHGQLANNVTKWFVGVPIRWHLKIGTWRVIKDDSRLRPRLRAGVKRAHHPLGDCGLGRLLICCSDWPVICQSSLQIGCYMSIANVSAQQLQLKATCYLSFIESLHDFQDVFFVKTIWFEAYVILKIINNSHCILLIIIKYFLYTYYNFHDFATHCSDLIEKLCS